VQGGTAQTMPDTDSRTDGHLHPIGTPTKHVPPLPTKTHTPRTHSYGSTAAPATTLIMTGTTSRKSTTILTALAPRARTHAHAHTAPVLPPNHHSATAAAAHVADSAQPVCRTRALPLAGTHHQRPAALARKREHEPHTKRPSDSDSPFLSISALLRFRFRDTGRACHSAD
jgi:hypothetical protein